MKITIGTEPVALPKVLYVNGYNEDGIVSMVVFNRADAARKMFIRSQVGDVVDVVGHWEHDKQDARYIVDMAIKMPSEDENALESLIVEAKKRPNNQAEYDRQQLLINELIPQAKAKSHCD